MTKRYLTVGLLAVALSACGMPGEDELIEEAMVEEGTAGLEKDDHAGNISFSVLEENTLPATPGATEARRVFKSSSSFRSYFGVSAPVDFSRYWLAYYAGGENSGLSASITKIRVSSGTLRVTTQLKKFGRGCIYPAVVTRPRVLVKFRKPWSNPSRVLFYRSDVTDTCAPACNPASEPHRGYLGDAEMCTRIRFFCTPDSRPFSNACGCGCETKDPASCTQDSDCTTTWASASSPTEPQCACSCPGSVVNHTTATAYEAGWNSFCATLPPPNLACLCAQPPPVGCRQGQCVKLP